MKSSVQIHFATEDDPLRRAPNSPTNPSASQRALHKLVQSAMGNVKVDRSGHNMYYTAKDCIKVRRMMEVDSMISHLEDREGIFSKSVGPMIDRLFEESHDVLVFVTGESGTSKTQFIHGATLDPDDHGLAVPGKEQWGIAFLAVARILELAKNNPCEITATALRVHHDHIADLLISASGLRLTKVDAQKKRQQYAKLLALTKAPTLDLQESFEGRFTVADQLDCTVRELDDFLHVSNCYSAVMCGKQFQRLGGKKAASPISFLTTLRVWKRDQPPHYVHIVELADSDWVSPNEEETANYRKSMQLVADICAAISHRDFLRAKHLLRDSTLTRIVFSNVNLESCEVAVFGLSPFAGTLSMMEYLAQCRDLKILIVLHGPDGEGEDDVDPELREHVLAIQEQCEDLRKVVEGLKAEKADLEAKLVSGEETVSRLKQQCDIVRKLTATFVAKNPPTSADTVTPPPAQQTDVSVSRAELRMTPAELAKRKALQLERELQAQRDEERQRLEACQRQVKFMTEEKARLAAKNAALQKQYATLKQKYDAQEDAFKKERATKEADRQARISEAVDRNRAMLDAHNDAMRQRQEQALQRSAELEERKLMRETILMEELAAQTSEVMEAVRKENESWVGKETQLKRQLEALVERRKELEREKLHVEMHTEQQLAALDKQSAALCQYAHDITKTIANFEGYHSTAAKEAFAQIPKCGVPIFDPAVKHTNEWFERQCTTMRKWLDRRGFPRPALYCDIASGRLELAKPQELPVPEEERAPLSPNVE